MPHEINHPKLLITGVTQVSVLNSATGRIFGSSCTRSIASIFMHKLGSIYIEEDRTSDINSDSGTDFRITRSSAEDIEEIEILILNKILNSGALSKEWLWKRFQFHNDPISVDITGVIIHPIVLFKSLEKSVNGISLDQKTTNVLARNGLVEFIPPLSDHSETL
ncbi:hypothetical protein [Tardibacter chloracetimidivorans]|uniref:hypothetical protein n=1 Tax=Tardibacter chloracetimidivorans TaxID=1921510 RepID=UPI00130147DB|nr:hypothetical protein [Tardibacter chloracetimidivorans]